MVVLAIYLVTSFMPGHISACLGQYPEKISNVFFPSRISVDSIHRFMKSPPSMSATLKNGAVQPPYLKPSASSSFDSPGACMTPSSVINSCTTIFLAIANSPWGSGAELHLHDDWEAVKSTAWADMFSPGRLEMCQRTPYRIECSPNILPSVSRASEINPYSPIDIFGF